MNIKYEIEFLRDILKKKFGLSHFREGQLEIISHILEGGSALCVLPTGGGKSLCYQLPALVLPGLTVIISPLISLMKDQVDSLMNRGIEAAFINSTQSIEEQRKICSKATAGQIKMLYISPERFRNPLFINSLRGIKVSLFAVDEAHCISQWGHDFRPDYLRLKNAAQFLQAERILACTATATSLVRDSIRHSLGIEKGKNFVFGFNRPNISLFVEGAPKKANKVAKLKNILANNPGSAIIYAATRKNAEYIMEALEEYSGEMVLYHAGLDDEERKKAQDAFMAGDAKIAVATNAFGMGIDRSDIRLVVHWDIPGSLEALYQEIGRAGRDGKPSKSIVLFSFSDKFLQEFFIKNANPSYETIIDVYEAMMRVANSDGTVLKTYEEIAQLLPSGISATAVSGAVIALEKGGIVRRLGTSGKNAFIRAIIPIESIEKVVSPRQKVRLMIVQELKKMEGPGGELSIENFSRINEISRDYLKRELSLMDEEGLISYEPPFRGRGVEILKDNVDDLDEKAISERRNFEDNKLKRVIGYCTTLSCRRFILMDYFGEAHPGLCSGCDNCISKKTTAKRSSRILIEVVSLFKQGASRIKNTENSEVPSLFNKVGSEAKKSVDLSGPRDFSFGKNKGESSSFSAKNIEKAPITDEKIIERLIIEAVQRTGERVGTGKIIDILKGSKKRDILAMRPERWPVYGSLASLKSETINEIIEKMLRKRVLVKTPGIYPILKLQ